MKKIFYIFGATLLFLILVLALIVWQLFPPHIKTSPRKNHVIAGVTLLNPGYDPVENQTIIIEDGVIKAIKETHPDDPAPICPGCFVMPGLIDAHIHTPPKLAIGNQRLFSLLYLKYGITSVRDLGQLDDSLPALINNISKGKIIGPRMYHCGPILDGESPAVPGSIVVHTEQQGIEQVKALAKENVSCIKVYDKIPRDAFIGIAAQAQRENLPLVGHTPHAVKLTEISNFEIAHFTGIPYLENDPPEGFAYRTQDLIDLTPQNIDTIITLMKRNNLSILPTTANAYARLTVSDKKRFPATQGLQHLPKFWELLWPVSVSHPETFEEIETDLKAIPAGLTFLNKARLQGIDVLAGTDVIMPYMIPGESLHLQLERFEQAFGSPELALQAATSVNGRTIDAGKIGHLEVGAYADLLLLQKDPRDRLANAQDWSFLITNGRLYERSYIEKAVARYDRHFNGPLYSKVLNTAFSFIGGEYRHGNAEN